MSESAARACSATAALDKSPLELLVTTWCAGRLLVEGFPILHTPFHELGPLRYDRDRIDLLGQKTPQRRMVPTQFMQRAIAVLSNAPPQLLDLRDQLLRCHLREVLVHRVPPRASYEQSKSFRRLTGGA